MYLVDTNVWLERLLNQDKSDQVGRFLNDVSPRDLFITRTNKGKKTPAEITL